MENNLLEYVDKCLEQCGLLEYGNIFTPSNSPPPPEWTNVGRDKWSVIPWGLGGSGRVGRVQEVLGGSRRVRRFWRFQEGPGEFGRVREGLEGSGRVRTGPGGSGRVQEGPGVSRSVREGPGGSGGLRGSGRVWKGPGRSGRVHEGAEV